MIIGITEKKINLQTCSIRRRTGMIEKMTGVIRMMIMTEEIETDDRKGMIITGEERNDDRATEKIRKIIFM